MMVSSSATTVQEYLDSLPPERRQAMETMRDWLLDHLPAGYAETMRWGMISYEIPLATYPNTYNGQPLSFAALAAQKRHYSLYLMSVYQNPALYQRLLDAYAAKGVKPDMGKSCIRFHRVAELPLEALGRIVQVSVEAFIAQYEASRQAPA